MRGRNKLGPAGWYGACARAAACVYS